MPEFATRAGGFTIRPGTRGDREAVADLFLRAEPDVPLTPVAYGEMWDWLHWRNPLRASDVLLGHGADGTLDGHVAMLPLAFRANGADVVAGWPCQLMVDDGSRGSMLYPALVQRLLRLCKTGRYAFAYALINRPRVLKANIALGLRPIGAVPVWVRPYRPSRLARGMLRGIPGGIAGALATPVDLLARLRLPSRSRAIVLEAVDRFHGEIEELFARTLRPRYRFIAERTAAALNWRFFGLPSRGYRVLLARENGRIAGYVAFRTMPMRQFTALAVADLWHDPDVPAAGRALLAATHRAAVASGVDVAACLMPRRSPMAAALRHAGFVPSPETFTLTVHEPGRDGPGTRSALDAWHPTWYDHDYV